MRNNTTTVEDLANPGATKDFILDHAYWSHDGSETDVSGYLKPKAGSDYADQKRIFKELGEELVQNAWNGYNCSLFAYGQTGSGKSYTVMGSKENKGLVPMICEKLFDDIEKSTNKDLFCQVKFSMIEIYNEVIRDLLSKKNVEIRDLLNEKTGLKLRQKNDEFFVENVTEVPVPGVRDVMVKIEEGNRQRTIASTQMNDMSSRAHTIVTLEFIQNFRKENVTKSARICMVDLAGSERSEQAGTSGKRLEEGKNINRSLLALGQVIKALCEKAMGKSIGLHIPYRDSVLTKLLKNALGGNSKTVMIATISPSSTNYEQTLSTLRYADRAKAIKNNARVNEGKTDAIMKELLEEKQRLLRELKEKGSLNLQASEDIQRMEKEGERKRINNHFVQEQINLTLMSKICNINEKARRGLQIFDTRIEILRKEKTNIEEFWRQMLEQTKQEILKQQEEEKILKDEKSNFPHLLKLTEDPSLSGYVFHAIKKDGILRIGSSRAKPKPSVVVYGPSVAYRNGSLECKNGEIYLIAEDGKVVHNGKEMKKDQRVKLNHYDRVLLGSNPSYGLFIFVQPKQAQQLMKKKKSIAEPTYEMAFEEIAAHTDVHVDISQMTDDKYLREQVVRMEQSVCEANTISKELKRGVTFKVILVSGMVLGKDPKESFIYVKVVKSTNGCEFLWPKSEFLDHYATMGVMYNKYLENDSDWEAEDPFNIPYDTPTTVGVAFVPLMSIAHMMVEKNEKHEVYDFDVEAAGHLTVSLVPCDDSGKESNKFRVQKPNDLAGDDINFRIQIRNVVDLPKRFKSSWCSFQLTHENETRVTKEVSSRNPNYEYDELVTMKNLTHRDIKYLEDSLLLIEILGRQVASIADDTLPRSRIEMDSKDIEISRLKTELQQTVNKLEKIREIVLESKEEKIARELLLKELQN